MRSVLAIVVGCAVTALAERGANADTLRLATMAPQSSPWGQVFKVWAGDVATKTANHELVDWQYGGVAGTEPQMVESMKKGQLDGAFLTSSGLGAIDRDLLAIEMPGLFGAPDKFDAALKTLTPYLRERLAAKGFVLLGFSDIGPRHFMGVGVGVSRPADLAGASAGYVAGDPVQAALFATASVSARGWPVAEVFPNLGGAIKIIAATSLGSEQAMWSSKVTHVSSFEVGYDYSAQVMTKAAYDRLAPDVRTVVLESGKIAADQLSVRIAGLDAAAFTHLTQTKTRVDAANRTEWEVLFAKTRASLRGTQNGFSLETFDKVVAQAK